MTEQGQAICDKLDDLRTKVDANHMEVLREISAIKVEQAGFSVRCTERHAAIERARASSWKVIGAIIGIATVAAGIGALIVMIAK